LQVALYARADLRVDVAICSADPLIVDRDILLDRISHQDLGRRWGSRFRFGLFSTPKGDKNGGDDEKRVKSRPDLLYNSGA
jgi:hypothetical protein